MMFIALMIGMVLLGSLLELGELAVLLIQGYPLAGFTLGCLGLVLCSGALIVIVLCLFRFHINNTEKKTAETAIAEYEEPRGEEILAEEVPEHVKKVE